MTNKNQSNTRTHSKWGAALLTLALLMIISACSDSVLTEKIQPESEISEIDGQPIKALSGREFYKTDWFEKKAVHLAGSYGNAIIRALNEKIASANSMAKSSIPIMPSVAVKNLGQYIQADNKGSLKQIGSTHIQVTQVDGEVEDYVLTVRPYISNPSQLKAAADIAYDAESTYLALSPDRFIWRMMKTERNYGRLLFRR